MSIPTRLGGRTVGLSRTADGDVVPSAGARARLRATDKDPVLAWVATLAVTALAAFLRLWDLGKPRAFLFDETYYAKDAWSLIHHGYALNYVDKANETLIYLSHSRQVQDGSAKMSISTVPLFGQQVIWTNGKPK